MAKKLVAPKVVAEATTTALYIGRGSKWGNPYQLSHGLTRATALEKYERHVLGSDLYNMLGELTGRALVCPGKCSPKPCHGDVLVRLWKERFLGCADGSCRP